MRILLVCLTAVGALCAQELPAELRARIDALLEVPENAPGCALGIVEGGVLLYARGYGLADLEAGTPIDTRSVFRIASTSKQFTAACVLLLAADGVVALDADIRAWLPELPEVTPAVRVRHLLHHTSGIPDYLWLIEDEASVADAYAALCAEEAWEFPAGARHEYSNSGYFLLSLLVEKAAGKSLRAFAEERLFAPLGMTRTHYHDDADERVPGRALGYSPRRRGGFREDMTRLEMVGDGGVFTCVEDLVRWERELHGGELLGEELQAGLRKRGTLASGEELRYAGGLVHGTLEGEATLRHGGAFVGFRAEILRLPERQLSVIILSNRGDAEPEDQADAIARLLLERKPRKREREDGGR